MRPDGRRRARDRGRAFRKERRPRQLEGVPERRRNHRVQGIGIPARGGWRPRRFDFDGESGFVEGVAQNPGVFFDIPGVFHTQECGLEIADGGGGQGRGGGGIGEGIDQGLDGFEVEIEALFVVSSFQAGSAIADGEIDALGDEAESRLGFGGLKFGDEPGDFGAWWRLCRG